MKWDLGRLGKLHARKGKGARGSGPRERMVPLINGAGVTSILERGHQPIRACNASSEGYLPERLIARDFDCVIAEEMVG